MADGDGRRSSDTTGATEAAERSIAPSRLQTLHVDATTIAADLDRARRTIEALIAFVRDEAAPPAGSGVDRAGDDPLVLREVAALEVGLHAAEAVLARAGRKIDAAVGTEAASDVAVALAEARVLVTEIVQAAGAKRAELSGVPMPPHRPVPPTRWTLHVVGNYVVNGAEPPTVGGQER